MAADQEERMAPDELSNQKLLSDVWWPLLIRILILNAEIPERFWLLVHRGENSAEYIKHIKLHKDPDRLEAFIRKQRKI